MPHLKTVADLISQGVSLIGKLAPLSIVVAALGILNTIRLARVKRRQDEAQTLREILNTAGTSAYTLNWSLLGGMDVKIPLLELRNAIEARLGTPVDGQRLSNLLNDQLLIEPMIGKAWRDSGAIDRFRQQALEFSRLSADIGARIPLIQEALEQINAHLRVLLFVDSSLIVSVRNKRRYRILPPTQPGQPVDPLHHVSRMFFSDSQLPNADAFQRAAGFLSTLAAATASTTDRRILLLARPQIFLKRWKDSFASNLSKYPDRKVRAQIAAQFQQNCPQEADLLTSALDDVLQKTRDLRRKEQILRQNAAHLLRTLGISGENPELKRSTDKLIQTLSEEYRDTILRMHTLIRLKSLGVADPEIDVHLATETGTLDLLKSATNRGATTVVGLAQILEQHAKLLSGIKEILLN